MFTCLKSLLWDYMSLKKVESYFSNVMAQELRVENNSLCCTKSQIKQKNNLPFSFSFRIFATSCIESFVPCE